MPAHGEDVDEDQPCRACADFKTWAKSRSKSKPSGDKPGTSKTAPEPEITKERDDCPLDKGELGRTTWGFLHTLASYYPKKATRQESEHMKNLLTAVAEFYPCEPCSQDFQEDLKKNPPRTCTRDELAKWLCERHNTVNIKLDKPTFDCSKVHERWRYGWKDGSCD